MPIVDLRQQTDVTEGGYDITLQPSRTEGEKTILPVLLENTGLKESYDLWQVGFFAEDPDEGEILFCISQASQAKHIPSEAESPGDSVTWNFYFNPSNTVPFEVVLNSNGLVNIEAYQEHTNAISEVNKKVDSLNSALNNIVTSPVIGEVTNYTTSEKEYINIAWSSYHLLLITWGSYGNVYQTILIPSTYIDSTNSGKRIIVGNDELQIYKKSENSLSARATTASQINRAIIYGIMPK